MLLCLSIGNTNIFGGVFQDDNLIVRFRHDTRTNYTSDQLGIFIKNILRENNLEKTKINKIAICSVVPSLDYSLRSACIKYFDKDPFILQHETKIGLKIKDNNSEQIGADLLANAIGAINFYPNQNIIIASLGTATTITAITQDKIFLGGAIMPGFRIAMESLHENTAKLSGVEIIKPSKAINLITDPSIQAGLYHGHLGAIKELIKLFIEEAFADQKTFNIGTGGFAHLFCKEKIFDVIEPDLILHGIRLAL